mmetsp:Transcript_4365/g.7661  ORF Transcript_4365/g.7661 Transcript_4365/m.7661 type:complete len:103 (-) Transcript_4365:1367-1675(-)
MKEEELKVVTPASLKGKWKETLPAEDEEVSRVIRNDTEDLKWYQRVRGMIKVLYFRWSVTTAVYMLGPREAFVVNVLCLLFVIVSLYSITRWCCIPNPVADG